MTHPPTNPPSDPGGGSTGPGRTDPLPQTGATDVWSFSPVADGTPDDLASLGRVPAGGPSLLESGSGRPVPPSHLVAPGVRWLYFTHPCDSFARKVRVYRRPNAKPPVSRQDAPAGPSAADTRSVPVPLVSVSRPFGVDAGGRWGFDSRRGAA